VARHSCIEPPAAQSRIVPLPPPSSALYLVPRLATRMAQCGAAAGFAQPLGQGLYLQWLDDIKTMLPLAEVVEVGQCRGPGRSRIGPPAFEGAACLLKSARRLKGAAPAAVDS
jgi:hypothetical protein